MERNQLASRQRWAIWLAVPVTGLVIAGLIALVDWAEVRASLRQASPAWIGLAAMATLATLWCRSSRLRCLLPVPRDSRVPGIAYFRATLLHQAVFVVLPSGTGDAALPLLARGYLGQTVGAATAAQLSARLQDLCVLIMLAAITTIWLAPQSVAAWAIGVTTLGLGALMLICSGCLIREAAESARRWLTDLRAGVLRNRAQAVASALGAWQAKHATWEVSARSTVWTAASWTAATVAILAVFAAIGLHLSPAQAVVVLIVANLAGAASFLTLAGLGVVDASLVLTLVNFGTDYDQALSLSIAARALLLSLNAVLPVTIEAALAFMLPTGFASRPKS